MATNLSSSSSTHRHGQTVQTPSASTGSLPRRRTMSGRNEPPEASSTQEVRPPPPAVQPAAQAGPFHAYPPVATTTLQPGLSVPMAATHTVTQHNFYEPRIGFFTGQFLKDPAVIASAASQLFLNAAPALTSWAAAAAAAKNEKATKILFAVTVASIPISYLTKMQMVRSTAKRKVKTFEPVENEVMKSLGMLQASRSTAGLNPAHFARLNLFATNHAVGEIAKAKQFHALLVAGDISLYESLFGAIFGPVSAAVSGRSSPPNGWLAGTVAAALVFFIAVGYRVHLGRKKAGGEVSEYFAKVRDIAAEVSTKEQERQFDDLRKEQYKVDRPSFFSQQLLPFVPVMATAIVLLGQASKKSTAEVFQSATLIANMNTLVSSGTSTLSLYNLFDSLAPLNSHGAAIDQINDLPSSLAKTYEGEKSNLLIKQRLLARIDEPGASASNRQQLKMEFEDFFAHG